MISKQLLASLALSVGCFSPFIQTDAQTGNVNFTEFQNPGNEARPRVWWHWMNGNITEDGIRKDIEWMHKVGVGGAHAFDAGLATPQIVKNRIEYMTPAWKSAFKLATDMLSNYGMELATANSPGWSQAGGPWVKPEDGMKKVVWREVYATGGKELNVTLPAPFTASGEFQNAGPKAANNIPEYYRDIAVIACKLPEGYKTMAQMKAQISASNGKFTLAQLTNNDYSDYVPLEINNHTSYINVTFPEAQDISAISLTTEEHRDYWSSTAPNCCRSIEYSTDGNTWQKITDIPDGGVYQQTVSFPAVKARYFRVVFHDPKPDQWAIMNGSYDPKAAPTTKVSELQLYNVPVINHAEEKAGYYAAWDTEKFPTPETVGVKDVVDITKYMDANGKLSWNAPKGNWKIFRFGYSLTGKENSPASPEATGLEVDKMDSAAVRRYETHYLNMYKDATGGKLGKNGLGYIVTDSYEAYQNNWTATLPAEFEKRHGYSLYKYLPVLTGMIVGDTKESENFLWDWRNTLGRLVVENYYEELGKILKENGMKRYSESQENGRVYFADGMEVKRNADIPMAAMWIPYNNDGTPQYMGAADIRESASVSHLYGQKLVAAESFTTVGFGCAWAFGPMEIRPTADLEFANGLNRIVVHESAHQATDDKMPGLNLGIFGTWFNRHITWADQAKSLTDYLARTSYMMQQGQNQADIAWYYGEDNNITGLASTDAPVIPEGYNWDYVNADALVNILNAKNGNLVSSKTGATYRILALDKNCNRMSMKVLRKLDELTKNGVTVCGDRPQIKGGMDGTDEEFNNLVNAIWSRSNVISGRDLKSALAKINVNPDFLSDKDSILFVHRKTDNGEFYWLDNRRDAMVKTHVTLRTSNVTQPQIWRAYQGTREQVKASTTANGTELDLTFDPQESYFVVFDKTAEAAPAAVDRANETEVLTLENPWNVKFQEQRGAPAETTMNTLASLSENSDEGIKYFSGTATYTTTFKLDKKTLKDSKALYLDLGKVGNIAEVKLNGKDLGTYWALPFRIRIDGAVVKGENTLEVKVTNFWTNRLIGDTQPTTKEKLTWTAMPFYQPNSLLLPSGLIGPVKIIKD